MAHSNQCGLRTGHTTEMLVITLPPSCGDHCAAFGLGAMQVTSHLIRQMSVKTTAEDHYMQDLPPCFMMDHFKDKLAGRATFML